jgi:hypothetical protein
MDNQQGKWAECRHGTGAYGGTWIENAVQAVARDFERKGRELSSHCSQFRQAVPAIALGGRPMG